MTMHDIRPPSTMTSRIRSFRVGMSEADLEMLEALQEKMRQNLSMSDFYARYCSWRHHSTGHYSVEEGYEMYGALLCRWYLGRLKWADFRWASGLKGRSLKESWRMYKRVYGVANDQNREKRQRDEIIDLLSRGTELGYTTDDARACMVTFMFDMHQCENIAISSYNVDTARLKMKVQMLRGKLKRRGLTRCDRSMLTMELDECVAKLAVR